MNHSHAPAIIDELYTSLCSLFYPGVNSRAELVTLAPGLRPERGFAPLARGLFYLQLIAQQLSKFICLNCQINQLKS